MSYVVPRRAGIAAVWVTSLLLVPVARTASQQSPVFRGTVQTVPVYATVTDASGAFVTDLTAGDFEVDDNGLRRSITVFKRDLQPITVAILVDRSPSLFPVVTRLQDVAGAFARRLIDGDRACLGTFSQVVSLEPALTNDVDALIRHFGDDVPWPAGTAMWDAIEAGRAALEREGGRRVILIVTDAADNCSRGDVDTIRTRIQVDGVMVYAVGQRGREGIDLGALTALARATGGWAFELRLADDVAAVAQRIADELHRQYVLGFSPRALDDTTHRIDVKVARRGLTVRARRSYFASSKADVR